MQDKGDNTFETQPSEDITIAVTIDNPPYMCSFPSPPHSPTWNPPPQRPDNKSETRFFTMPASGAVVFVVSYDESIPSGSPITMAIYFITITGSSTPNAPASRRVTVNKDAGPVPVTYTFRVK